MSLLLAILFSGCKYFGFIPNDNDVVATVNGEKITVRQYQSFLQTAKTEMENEAEQENIENFWETTEIDGKKAVDVAKEKALEAAVKNKVELLKAKEKGIELTSEEKQQIIDQKKNTIAQMGGRDAYNKALKQMGMNDQDLTEAMQTEILLRKLFTQVTNEDEKYNFSDELLREHYENTKEEYKNPQVRAKHILISTVDDEQQPLPQEEIDAARAKAEEIYAKIQAGEDFDQLMNEHSEDPGLQGNPDGYTFGKGEMVPEFEEAAFSLEAGQVSEIVESSYGYHIIKVEEKMDDYYTPFEEVKEQIKQELTQKEYDKEVEKWKQEAEIVTNENVIEQIRMKF